MKAVLLAGGLGTRMREETEYRPKPMVEIGGRPVIWHIMKAFAQAGVDEFVVATGYKGDMIKDYFLNYEGRNNDFTVTLGAIARHRVPRRPRGIHLASDRLLHRRGDDDRRACLPSRQVRGRRAVHVHLRRRPGRRRPQGAAARSTRAMVGWPRSPPSSP